MTVKHAELADVLDAAADYIDRLDGARHREKTAAREALIDDLAGRYRESTGEDLSGDLRKKLASLDEDVLQHVLKTSKTAGGSPDTLGGPADTTPTQKTAAEDDDPDARMFRFLTSD